MGHNAVSPTVTHKYKSPVGDWVRYLKMALKSQGRIPRSSAQSLAHRHWMWTVWEHLAVSFVSRPGVKRRSFCVAFMGPFERLCGVRTGARAGLLHFCSGAEFARQLFLLLCAAGVRLVTK